LASAFTVLVENPLNTKLDFKALKVAVLWVRLPIFFKLYFSTNFLASKLLLMTMVEEKVLVETSNNIAKQAVYNIVFIVDMIYSKVDNLINL